MKTTLIPESYPSLANLIRSTAAVHGVKWAAKYYAKKGVNISTVLYALFGRY